MILKSSFMALILPPKLYPPDYKKKKKKKILHFVFREFFLNLTVLLTKIMPKGLVQVMKLRRGGRGSIYSTRAHAACFMLIIFFSVHDNFVSSMRQSSFRGKWSSCDLPKQGPVTSDQCPWQTVSSRILQNSSRS